MNATFVIRKVESGEEAALWNLFHDTIHHVNTRDYTPEQVQAWAPDVVDAARWREKIERIAPYVCLSDGEIVGYADLQDDGLIDHFYVYHRWQRKGVGRRLMDTIEAEARERKLPRLYSHVSITARRFFESRGFHVLQQQEVPIGSVVLTNFRMTKNLPAGET